MMDEKIDLVIANLTGKSDLEHCLEPCSSAEHRGDLLSAEDATLLCGEVKVEPGHAEQFVGDQLPVADRPG